jgi:hypothetical protein
MAGATTVVGIVEGASGLVLEAEPSVGFGVVVGFGTTTCGNWTAIGRSTDRRPMSKFGSERMAASANANNTAVSATETAKLGPRFSGVG